LALSLRLLRLPSCLPALGYFLWSDCRLDEPDDAYWHLVASLSGRGIGAVRLLCCVNTFLVDGQGVFLAVDVVVPHLSDHGHTRSARRRRAEWVAEFLFQLLLRSAYTVDLLFCVVGYVMTVRLFDSAHSQHRADDARLGGRAN